mmetsp:Transcript_107162/g.190393  ORF Transcript_107162/g.190393 Transcript_107162/m.190393 type:complete len:238 (-) Transcript_107162:33-746(-)
MAEVSLPELYAEIVRNSSARLQKLSKARHEETELRLAMLGMMSENAKETAKHLEARGIARYHLAQRDGSDAAKAEALKDLQKARDLAPLVPEAQGILEKLEAENVQPMSLKSDLNDNREAREQSEPRQEPVSKAEPKKPVSKATPELPRPDKAPAAKSILSEPKIQNPGPDISIDVQARDDSTLVIASPAESLEVDVADGLVRFSRGEQVWNVPVDGTATGVKKRRGRLEVTVQRAS